MTNPINRHCKRLLEQLKAEQEQANMSGHDAGDEDPHAWDNEMETD